MVITGIAINIKNNIQIICKLHFSEINHKYNKNIWNTCIYKYTFAIFLLKYA